MADVPNSVVAPPRPVAKKWRGLRGVVGAVCVCAVVGAAVFMAVRPTLIRHAYLPRLSLSVPPADTPYGGPLMAVLVSPDGKTVAAAGDSPSDLPDAKRVAHVFLWNAPTGRLMRTITAHPFVVWNVDFSPDSRTLLTSGGDGKAKVWDMDTGKLLWAQPLSGDSVQAPRFSPDGRIVVSQDDRGRISTWNAQTGHLPAPRVFPPVADHRRWFGGQADVALSPDGSLLAVALPERSDGPDNFGQRDRGGEVRLYEMRTGRAVYTLPGMKVRVIAFSPDGRQIACLGAAQSVLGNGSVPCRVQVCDVPSGHVLWAVTYPKWGVTSLAFVPGADALAVYSGIEDSRVEILDADTGLLRRTLSPVPPPRMESTTYTSYGLAASQDGRTLVSRDSSRVLVWDVSSLHRWAGLPPAVLEAGV